MKSSIERLKRLCAFITGFVFFISGILKALDPTGAGLVMKEYLEFLHIGFLGFASKGLGTAFSLVETLIGAALITGVWRKATACAAMILQGFFTLLTLALVIFNPEMDCGCFGEAIHLTHGETFVKNLILCALLAVVLFPMKEFGAPVKTKYVSFGIIAISVLAFCIYSWMYIPIIDFTEYRQTAMLESADTFQESEEDMYEAVFIYEKNGETQTFDLQHLPDSTWTFVRTETVMEEEFEDNSISLSFYNADGEYSDELAAAGNVMVVSIYDPELKSSDWKETADFIRSASEVGYRPIILAASTPEEIQSLLQNTDEASRIIIEEHIYFSDYKTLLTLNRSNGGAVWFSDGYLIKKWAASALPDKVQMKVDISSEITEAIIEKSTTGSIVFQGFLLYVFAVMLLL